MTRYYGWYSNRTRGERERLGPDGGEAPSVAERERLTLSESRLRWAELLRRIYEVDPLRCPVCSGEMRIVAFITERAVIDRILDHLRRKREGIAAGDCHSTTVNPLLTAPSPYSGGVARASTPPGTLPPAPAALDRLRDTPHRSDRRILRLEAPQISLLLGESSRLRDFVR